MILVNEATLKENKLPELHDLLSQRTVCIPPLIDVLVQIPDPRKARGKRHPLQAMLALSCVALLCGYQSLLAISEWSHNYGLTYLPRLGFTRRHPPGQATWYRVLSKIDWQALEEQLADWVERVLAVLDSGNEWEGVALDGKTLRGSKKQGAADTHLLSALSHRLAITLTQVGDGTQTVVVDGAPRTVPMAEFAAAVEPEAWYDRVSHVDVNITENSGNTDSRNWLVFADTALKLGDHRHLGELTFTREKIDGVYTKKQDLFNYSYNWLFKGPWYLGGMFSYERDPIKDLDHRYTTGVTLGRDIFDDSNTFLTMSVGAGWSEEQFVGQPKDSGATALWNLRYTQDFVDGKFAFFHNHNINYHLYADNNMIFKSNTGVQFDLLADVYAKISFRYDYESEPAEGAQSDDTTLAIGIGAEF